VKSLDTIIFLWITTDLTTMDVSEFLKSFKKNVAGKAKGGTIAQQHLPSNSAPEVEELSDLLHSDSDADAEDQEQPTDFVVGGRADRLSGKRYGAHQKRNQQFNPLTVLSTNASTTQGPGRVHRHRAAIAQQYLSDTRKRPRAELVASVRAELLQRREQLRNSHMATESAEAAATAPVAQVTATMVHVDDLLSSASTAPATTAAISGDTAATLLDFLPPAPVAISNAKLAEATVASSATMIATTEGTTPAQLPGAPLPSSSSAPPLPPPVPSGAASERKKVAPPPPKKRSKFEVAKALANADDQE
jgi:cellobiose-specific phosphotransferase system component IIA